jgi:RND superfamily putative drug exporter
MSSALARIARTLTTHWKRGIVAGLVSLVALAATAATATSPSDSFSVPGTESQKAIDLFRAHTPALAGADATVVFNVDTGKITAAQPKAAIEGAVRKIEALPGVVSVSDPFARVAPNGRLVAADVRYKAEAQDIKPVDGERLQAAAASAEQAGVNVAMRGQVIDASQKQSAPVGELIGIALAIVLLTLLFRSWAAMATTLFGALLGVMVGQLLLAILARPLGLPSFASTIAVMLGLGAGIDYALLILARFREQMSTGSSLRDASAKAAATAGASVVAAGVIVMIAIAGLLVVGIPFVGKMGIGAAIGVAAVVVSALTFLPVMIGAFGRWLRPKSPKQALSSPGFERWGRIVTAHPWRAVVAGVALLLVFAFPLTSLRLGQPDDGNQPATKTQRVAYDRLSAAFGAGSNGPFLIAIDDPQKPQLAKLQASVARTPDVAAALPAVPSRDGEIAVMTVIPKTSPQDQATSDLVSRLRGEVIPRSGVKAYVGGQTAVFEDMSDKVAQRLPLFIAVVIGMSVLLLMMAFRSLWIPLVSAAFNLLSIGAAYGVVVAVFQKGIGASLIGVDSGVPVVSFVPVMLFAILFGLSMDYNVFLLSRMHEAYNEGDGPRESVVHGVARIGKVVLFAGLIMTSVFLAFVIQDDVIAKMMGLGLGLAILIDVLIVRLVIAPAVVTLLGHRAWWLPSWLDRVLPNVSLEGHLVESERVPA